MVRWFAFLASVECTWCTMLDAAMLSSCADTYTWHACVKCNAVHVSWAGHHWLERNCHAMRSPQYFFVYACSVCCVGHKNSLKWIFMINFLIKVDFHDKFSDWWWSGRAGCHVVIQSSHTTSIQYMLADMYDFYFNLLSTVCHFCKCFISERNGYIICILLAPWFIDWLIEIVHQRHAFLSPAVCCCCCCCWERAPSPS
jgi:hypothetical protein